MKALRVLLMSALAVLLLGAAAVAGFATIHADEGHLRGVSPDASPTITASPTAASPSAGTDPSTPPEPEFVLRPGDQGPRVRQLQYRLHQLAWWPELTTGTYDGQTREAVKGFQAKRGFRPTGLVDRRTWARLVTMTEQPTHDQLFNVLHPGPVLFGAGAAGEEVRAIQSRLIQIAWLYGDVSGTYDSATVEAVKGFQAKREIPVTGDVDQRTLDRLVAMTYAPTYEEMHNIRPEPGALDPRCTTGRALCVDKSTNSMRWVIGGKTMATYDVRFGSEELPTREGAFAVFLKSRDHVSTLYHTSMPLAMFFSGGQAVHYSPDFAAHGYAGASHGCVNVRDYNGMLWLFDQVQVGDKVIIYWS